MHIAHNNKRKIIQGMESNDPLDINREKRVLQNHFDFS